MYFSATGNTQYATKRIADAMEDNGNPYFEVNYEESRRTELIKVNDVCVGCGVCAGQCLVGAIEMQEQKPVWIKEKCLLCLECVHKCPMNAIAYTDEMIGHKCQQA